MLGSRRSSYPGAVSLHGDSQQDGANDFFRVSGENAVGHGEVPIDHGSSGRLSSSEIVGVMRGQQHPEWQGHSASLTNFEV